MDLLIILTYAAFAYGAFKLFKIPVNGFSLLTAALGGKDRTSVLSADRLAAEGFSGTRRADASGMLLVLTLLLAAAELAVATRTR